MSWADRALLLLIGLALFLPGIGSRDLWNPDEPRYAQVAREMLDSGELLVALPGASKEKIDLFLADLETVLSKL